MDYAASNCLGGKDELKLYRGDDYKLTDKITIMQPTLGQICDFGEERYLSMISILVAAPFDMVLPLTEIGIDYTEIDNFQLFCLLVRSMTPKDTHLLFGDLDFSKFKLTEKNGAIVLINRHGVEINEFTREIMADHIRKMHHIPKQKHNKVANEFAKQALIDEALRDARRAKKRREMFGVKSIYLPLISSLVNHPGFKYNMETVWDLKINAFFDSVQRIQVIENTRNLYSGLYSGCIEYNKIKKDLNWMRELK